MWSPVTSGDTTEPAPASRCKHSATLLHGHVYLLGGRSGNVPLKDFWRYSLAEGRWTQVEARGERPPCLQEHTAVAWRDQIYVFGGEVGFSAAGETPLWVFDAGRSTWRKVRARRGVQVPRARRGHTALVHHASASMLLYGGYQDLRGSSADLWAFHFDTESWHLLSAAGTVPPARHKHSAVLHDDVMWVYGGMTDLVARADLWRWDTRARSWAAVRAHGAHRPGALHGHAATAAHRHMLLLGGDDVWRFAFDTETWERLEVSGVKPQSRSEAVALTVSDLHTAAPLETHMARTRLRTAPNNRVQPLPPTSTTTYVLNNGPSSLMARLAQMPRGRGGRCSYTVLQADSTESLLRAHNTTGNDDTPTRLPKSRSAYHNTAQGQGQGLPRDPVSVPNFVFLNSDSEDDDINIIQVKPAAGSKQVVIVENVARDQSYSSHLGYAASSTSDYASLSLDTSDTELDVINVFRTRGGGFCNPNYLEVAAALKGSSGAAPESVGVDLELLELGQPRRRAQRDRRAISAGRATSGGAQHSLFVYLVGGKERHVTVFKRPVSIWKLQLY